MGRTQGEERQGDLLQGEMENVAGHNNRLDGTAYNAVTMNLNVQIEIIILWCEPFSA